MGLGETTVQRLDGARGGEGRDGRRSSGDAAGARHALPLVGRIGPSPGPPDVRDGLLRAVERRLARRTHEVEQLVYTISHDLKSPIVTINGFLELLREGLRAGDAALVERALERIERSTARMDRMVDGLLDLRGISTAATRREEFALEEALAGLLASLRPRLDEADARVRLVRPLPGITVNRQLLMRAFENLIVNAIQHARPVEGGSLQITIDHVADGREVHLRVHDNGAGIAPEALAHLRRSLSGSPVTAGGSGLGLAIVDRIVSAHGGELAMDTEPGAGTVMIMSFPRVSFADHDGRTE